MLSRQLEESTDVAGFLAAGLLTHFRSAPLLHVALCPVETFVFFKHGVSVRRERTQYHPMNSQWTGKRHVPLDFPFD